MRHVDDSLRLIAKSLNPFPFRIHGDFCALPCLDHIRSDPHNLENHRGICVRNRKKIAEYLEKFKEKDFQELRDDSDNHVIRFPFGCVTSDVRIYLFECDFHNMFDWTSYLRRRADQLEKLTGYRLIGGNHTSGSTLFGLARGRSHIYLHEWREPDRRDDQWHEYSLTYDIDHLAGPALESSPSAYWWKREVLHSLAGRLPKRTRPDRCSYCHKRLTKRNSQTTGSWREPVQFLEHPRCVRIAHYIQSMRILSLMILIERDQRVNRRHYRAMEKEQAALRRARRQLQILRKAFRSDDPRKVFRENKHLFK